MEAPVMNQSKLIKELNNLIALDFDAIAAYESAVKHLENLEYKTTLDRFKLDHNRHVDALSRIVREMGGDPANGADVKVILTQGKVIIANLFGNDMAILKAMKINEDVTNLAYEKATAEMHGSDELMLLLANHLEDERRHRAWIESVLHRE